MGFLVNPYRFAGILYKYWQQGAANNGRPYWDLASTSSGVLPTGSLAPSGSDWGFMIDLGANQAWSEIIFSFGESHTAQGFDIVVSDVSTGAAYCSGAVQGSTTLTLTRASLVYQGTVGSGIAGIPSSARYFGFGEGDSGETFTVTGVTIA